MARRKSSSSGEIKDTGKWITTYADLMNNLLVFFIMLYGMSIMDNEKFEALADQFREMYSTQKIVEFVEPPYLHKTPINDFINENKLVPIVEKMEFDIITFKPEPDIEEIPDASTVWVDEFDELFLKIKVILVDKGYDELINVEKEEGFIYFRFNDGILFYPDLAELKPESYTLLGTVAQIIRDAGSLIAQIDIAGHTAKIDKNDSANFKSWKLSSERSLSVLEYFIMEMDLPESKMSITGYAHFQPLGDESTAEGRSINRRVEIKLAKKVS